MCREYQNEAVLEMLDLGWIWHLKHKIIRVWQKKCLKKEIEQNYFVLTLLIWILNYDKLLKHFVFQQFTPKCWVGCHGMQTHTGKQWPILTSLGFLHGVPQPFFGQLSVFSPSTFHLAKKSQVLDQRRGIWGEHLFFHQDISVTLSLLVCISKSRTSVLSVPSILLLWAQSCAALVPLLFLPPGLGCMSMAVGPGKPKVGISLWMLVYRAAQQLEGTCPARPCAEWGTGRENQPGEIQQTKGLCWGKRPAAKSQVGCKQQPWKERCCGQ